MKDLVVIIPLHEYNEEIEASLSKAIKSVPKGVDIIISCANGLAKDLNTAYKKNKNIRALEGYPEDTRTDFCSLVNSFITR